MLFKYSQKPQKIIDVLLDGFKLYKLSFSKVWPWTVAAVLIARLPTFFWENTKMLKSIPIPYLVLPGLISIFISTLLYCFILILINKAAFYEDEPISVSLKVALKKIWPVLGAFCLIFLLFTLLGLPAGAFIFLALQVNWAFGLALIVWAALVLFLYVKWAFYLPLILFDNKSPWKSIKQSAQLVRKKWWKTFLTLFSASILVAVIPYLLLFTKAFFINSSFGTIFAMTLVQCVLAGLLSPFLSSTYLVLFYDLKSAQNWTITTF